MEHEDLTGRIIGCAMTVHRVMGAGFLETIYHKALMIELQKQGVLYESEKPVEVSYAGHSVGNYYADLLVSGTVIVELKAVEKLSVSHEVQLVNYLTATGFDIGLLINFGGSKLEFKRKFRQKKVSS
ncbi:MAG: GxxExxY protein [Blastochloris sp.]|nr:GxxExxY protein [Blastochloris sp.]